MKGRILVALAAVAALGCNKNGTAPQGGISGTCSVTLSGALSGTYDCRPATTAWSNVDNTGGFSFGVSASGSGPAISVAIVWLGEPRTRTYTESDSAATASLTVTTSSNQSWRAAVGDSITTTGSYGLAFSSLVNDRNTSAGKGYAAEGALIATLPAVAASGATGVVMLTVTF